MKKLLKLSLGVVLVALVLAFASCSGASGGGNAGPDYVGTWYASVSGMSNTMIITATTLSMSGSLGTLSSSITSADTGAGHLLLSVSSSTGVLSMYASGSSVYLTYSVSGSTMYISMSNSSYPSTATGGPYTKQ